MRSILVMLLFAVSSIAYATKYYISSSGGNDTSDGKTEATAWRTLSQVNGNTFLPGDEIYLKRGDAWRENLKIPSSGLSGSFITFSNYGTGPNPVIYGSGVSSGWTNYGGNIWVSSSSFDNPRKSFSCEVFFVEKDQSVSWGHFMPATGSLSSEYDWTWSGNKIYIYSPEDPYTRYSGIEIPQRQSCIDLNNMEFIDINGIDMFYGIYEGITYNWKYDQLKLNGLVIENCSIAYIGGNITSSGNENGFGIDVAYSDMVVRNCEIYNCGRRGISFHLYGSGFTVKNVLIERNYFHDGHHTTGIDISVGSGSFTGSFDGISIRRNLFFDPPGSPFHSVQIFVQNYNYTGLQTSVNNVYIYSNIFKSPTAAGVMVEGAQSVFIYNNTFYNHNTTKSGNLAHLWIDMNNALVRVKNNIFYTDLSNDNSGNGMEIYCLTDPAKVDADYNLYYRINNSLRIIRVNSTNYYMNSIAEIRSRLGWEINSPVPALPMFVSSADYHLQNGSPAISKGLTIPEVTEDYDGNSFGSSPNIGCFAGSGENIAPVYLRSSVENATPSLLSMIFSESLADTLPDPAAFRVQINDKTVTVKGLSISGTGVSLILSTPAVYGNIISVAYTRPANNPLQTPFGQPVASFNAQQVTNNVLPLNPAYISSVIENSAPEKLIMTYNLELSPVIPPLSAFSVKVNSLDRSLSTITINGKQVILVLGSSVTYNDLVRVSYSKPPVNPIQTTDGGEAANISSKPVINNVLEVTGPGNENNLPFAENVTIYPNPASDYLNISFEQSYMHPVILLIISSTGELVSEEVIGSGNNSAGVSLMYPSGMYLLKFLMQNVNLGTEKLIITK